MWIYFIASHFPRVHKDSESPASSTEMEQEKETGNTVIKEMWKGKIVLNTEYNCCYLRYPIRREIFFSIISEPHAQWEWI